MNEDEIVAALEANPELQTGLFNRLEPGITKHLTEGKGMFVASKDDYTKTTQKAINEAIGQNHKGYEEKIEKLTGIKKNAGESGHDYFDRVSANLKYQKEGDTNESAVVNGLRTELKGLRDEITQKDTALFNETVNTQVAGAMNGLKFAVPAHLKKDDEIAAYQRSKAAQMGVVFKAAYTAKKEDGVLVYVNGKNEAQMLDGQPMTADQIATRDFAADLAPKGKSQGGAGSLNDDPNSKNEGYLAATPTEIEKKLGEMGLAYMTPAWEEKYRAAMKAIGKGL